MNEAPTGFPTNTMATIGSQETQFLTVDHGFAAIFGSMYNNGAEESPLQGLCFDLINLCQPVEGRNRKPMPVFSQILNAIPEVVNLNQRPNSATNSDISQSTSEIDWVIHGSRTSTYSSPFTETNSEFSHGEHSGTESESNQSIASNCLPIPIRYFEERGTSGMTAIKTPNSGTASHIENSNNVRNKYPSLFSPQSPPPPSFAPIQDQSQAAGQGGGNKQDLKNLPISMSEDVMKALRQFGLEGCLMPLPSNKGPHESNSFPRMGTAPRVASPGIGAGEINRQGEISGDTSENEKGEEWMSPLNISGTMLTGLLNRFTTGGGADAESSYTD